MTPSPTLLTVGARSPSYPARWWPAPSLCSSAGTATWTAAGCRPGAAPARSPGFPPPPRPHSAAGSSSRQLRRSCCCCFCTHTDCCWCCSYCCWCCSYCCWGCSHCCCCWWWWCCSHIVGWSRHSRCWKSWAPLCWWRRWRRWAAKGWNVRRGGPRNAGNGPGSHAAYHRLPTVSGSGEEQKKEEGGKEEKNLTLHIRTPY